VIITCPKCARKHKVNPDSIKSFLKAKKKTILATCRSCKFKFPVVIDTLVSSPEQAKPQVPPKPQESPEPEVQSDSPVARKICITLSKGGVGKTTTSVNLGAGLALAGYKVLLVDTDTQGQTSYILGKRPAAGLTELLTKELPVEECVVEARKNLWLLGGGANPWLA